MSGVDNRVVTMTFDNKVFEQKVGETIGSLDKLKTALKFDGANKAFDEISSAASKLNFGTMHTAIDSINAKFLALSTVAVTALSSITNKAIDAGISIAKSLAVTPVLDGLHEYETNIGSIQTILANTASKGTNLDQVNSALDQLNTYSDKTIYNFGQMAKNIGTFTAAGVDLDTSVSSIKGIANIAAMSGSSADQASTAMYQLSQAIAGGSLKLMDWNSVVNAGMGGEALQNALFETGKAMGTLNDVPIGQTFKQWTDSGHSFRESLKDGWVTADVLTTTLGTFTGDMTKEMLVAKGFSAQMADQILATAQIAQNAATKVKTFTQLVDTTKEQIGTGWADSFKLIIGNFEQAQGLFTMISNSIGKVIGENNQARNSILAGWNMFGGRQAIIEAMINTWQALGGVLRPIQAAFREVFPPTMVVTLLKLSGFLRDFTQRLEVSGETGNKIKSVFKGIFSIFSIGISIVKGIAHVFTSLVSALFGLTSGAGGGFLSIAAGIGEFISRIRELLVTGGVIEGFFGMLATVLTLPIKLITLVKDAVVGLISTLFSSFGGFGGIFSGATSAFDSFGGTFIEVVAQVQHWLQIATLSVLMFVSSITAELPKIIPIVNKVFGFMQEAAAQVGDFFGNLFGGASDGASAAGSGIKKISDDIGGLSVNMSFLGKVGKALGDAFGTVSDVLSTMWDNFKNNLSGVTSAFGEIGKAIGDAFSNIKWDKVLEGAKIGLAAGIVVVINNFVKKLNTGSLISALTGGLSDKIGGTFEQLTSTLKSMQKQIKVDMLLKIAEAMAILVISMIALSFIDGVALGKALIAMSIGFAELAGVFKLLDSVTSGGKKILAFAAGMLMLAAAIGILSLSLAIMAGLDLAGIGKGLLAIGAFVGMIILLSHTMGKDTEGLAKMGLSLIVLSAGLLVLSIAMKVFAGMDWPTMTQGLVGVGVAVGLMVTAMRNMPDKGVKEKAASLFFLSLAIAALGRIVKTFGEMDWPVLVQGLLGTAAALAILVIALKNMPDNLKEISLGLLLVAVSLNLMVNAITTIANMDVFALAQGLIGIGVALFAIQAAANAMVEALPGAYAIAVIAGSLLVLAGAVKVMSDLGAMNVVEGILAIVLVIAALAATSVLLQEATPFMILMGAALQELAFGFVLFGAAAILFAGAVFLIAFAFEKFAAVSDAGANHAVSAINTLIEAVPGFIKRLVSGFLQSIDDILSVIPGLMKIFAKILDGLIDLLTEYIPKIVDVIVILIQALLDGIREIFPDIVQTGVDIVLALLEGIRDNIDNIITVALEIVQNLLDSLMVAIPMLVTAGVEMILALIQGIADNIQMIIDAGVNLLIQFLFGITRDVIHIVEAVGTIITAFITALAGEAIRIAQAGTDALIAFLTALTVDAVRIASAITTLITTLITEMGNNALLIIHAGTDALIRFLEGINADIHVITPYILQLINTIFDELIRIMETMGKRAADFVVAFFQVVADATIEIADGARKVLVAWLGAMATEIIKLTNDIAHVLIAFLDGMSLAIDQNDDAIAASSHKLAKAIVTGIAKAFGLQEMKDLLVAAAKKLLGPLYSIFMALTDSNSPSKEYMKIGRYIVQGLAIGITESAPAEEAMRTLVGNTTDAFNNAMRMAVLDMSSMDEFNPVITPVLDLTQAMTDAKALNDLTMATPITANLSLAQANTIAHTNATPVGEATTVVPSAPTTVSFEQNIYAPEALSTNDIYRLTRSQIALAKEELKIP